jgi:hypothetical protein
MNVQCVVLQAHTSFAVVNVERRGERYQSFVRDAVSYLSGVDINSLLIIDITIMVCFVAKFAPENGTESTLDSSAIPITAQLGKKK